MGLRAYYVAGLEARVEWPSVAVDVPQVWGQCGTDGNRSPPEKTNTKTDAETDAEAIRCNTASS